MLMVMGERCGDDAEVHLKKCLRNSIMIDYTINKF